jgi:magnesium-transporting ATPase (P-type)
MVPFGDKLPAHIFKRK